MTRIVRCRTGEESSVRRGQGAHGHRGDPGAKLDKLRNPALGEEITITNAMLARLDASVDAAGRKLQEAQSAARGRANGWRSPAGKAVDHGARYEG